VQGGEENAPALFFFLPKNILGGTGFMRGR
jgi:hypothetical protein